MQALIEIIAGFVAMLAAAALSQFGLDMDTPQKPQREIHRVHDCGGDKGSSAMLAVTSERDQDC